jgi:hypothetical protein
MDNGIDAIHVAIRLQIDPEACVREDRISKNGVVDGAGVMHPDSGETGNAYGGGAVEGDNVGRSDGRAAHGVVVPVNQYALPRLDATHERLRASDIGADDVTLDNVAGTVGSENQTRVANATVARDQIAGRRAGSGCQAPDKRIQDAAIEIHANVRVRHRLRSSYIRTYEVALHRVVRSAPQINAAVVCGNDIAGGNGGATNEIV